MQLRSGARRHLVIILSLLLVGASCPFGDGARAHAAVSLDGAATASPAESSVTIYAPFFNGTLNPAVDCSPGQDLVFARLLDIAPNGELRPGLLRDVPSRTNGEMSTDGKTITLRLRPHLQWSSGAEITTADIRFGWRVFRDPSANLACGGGPNNIASIALPNRYTAVLHLSSAAPDELLSRLPFVLPHAWRGLGTTPHQAALHLFGDSTFTYVGRDYWTDGPFRAVRRLARTCLLLQRMPHYHVHQLPRLAAITYCGAFSSTPPDISILGTVHQLTDLASPGGAHSLSLSPSVTLANLELNVREALFQGRPNPLLDVRVRQALALATDRVTLARNVLGATTAQARALAAPSIYFAPAQAPGIFSGPSLRGAWDPLARAFIPYGTQSLADARRLLAAAGYGAGLPLDLAAFGSHPWRLATLTELARQWKAIGVQATIRRLPECFPCDPGLVSGNFEGFLGEIPDGPDPTALDQYLTGPRVTNVAGIADARLQAALSQGRRSIDLSSRAPAYRTAQTIMAKQVYWIPLYYLPDVILHDPHLIGPAASAVPGQETFHVSSWHFAG